jgi:hypothetical protein
VVLVATRNPLNIGAAARAMANFDFQRLRVVNPYEVAFREARSAVGASRLLANAEEYGNVAEAVAGGNDGGGHRELQHPLSLDDWSTAPESFGSTLSQPPNPPEIFHNRWYRTLPRAQHPRGILRLTVDPMSSLAFISTATSLQ